MGQTRRVQRILALIPSARNVGCLARRRPMAVVPICGRKTSAVRDGDSGRAYSSVGRTARRSPYFRCRIFARMRRFLRPSFRRPLPDFFTPILKTTPGLERESPLRPSGKMEGPIPETVVSTLSYVQSARAATIQRLAFPGDRFKNSLASCLPIGPASRNVWKLPPAAERVRAS